MYHAKIGYFELFWPFGVVFGYLTSPAHVCYGGLSKRSQSDKVCTMPKLVILNFFDLLGSFLAIWHPLHMFAMGDFQKGLRVIRYVPCQNCQPRFFQTACQTVIFASGVTKHFENYDSIFLAAFYWTFVSNFFPIPKIALCKDPVYWPGFFPIFSHFYELFVNYYLNYAIFDWSFKIVCLFCFDSYSLKIKIFLNPFCFSCTLGLLPCLTSPQS